jgi:alpha,alpha-trehalose phosphorylase
VWQAATLGFAGVSWDSGTLRLSPRLPDGWQSLCFALHWRESRLRVRLEATTARLEVESGPSIDLEVCGMPVHVPATGGVSVALCQ